MSTRAAAVSLSDEEDCGPDDPPGVSVFYIDHNVTTSQLAGGLVRAGVKEIEKVSHG
ncbi:MAG: hypothetical protein M3P00_10505 [Gemmatimonadota bacterium]|nr:hypothetical protein [Gemmatimonadota bacterium]